MAARFPRHQRRQKPLPSKREPSLFDDAKEGNCKEIRRRLELGEDPNQRHPTKGYTPLHFAAKHGRLEAVEVLLDQGAIIDGLHKYEETPLVWAAKEGQLDVVRLLVERGANVNAFSKGRFSLLHLLIESDVDCVVDEVKMLLEKGAFVDVEDSEGRTPLIAAEEDFDIEEHDMDEFRDELLRGRGERTKRGRRDLFEILLKYGADVNAKSKDGESVLTHAVDSDSLKTVRYWVRKGAKVTNHSLTSYHLLSGSLFAGGNKRLLRYLVDMGARFDLDDGFSKPLGIFDSEMSAAEEQELWDEVMREDDKADDEIGDDEDDTDEEDSSDDDGILETLEKKRLEEAGIIDPDTSDDDDDLTPEELAAFRKEMDQMRSHAEVLQALTGDGGGMDFAKAFGALKALEEMPMMRQEQVKFLRFERKWLKQHPDEAISLFLKAAALGDAATFRRLHKQIENISEESMLKALKFAVAYKDNADKRHAIASILLDKLPESEVKSYDCGNGFSVLAKAVENGLQAVVEKVLTMSYGRDMVLQGTPRPMWLAANANYKEARTTRKRKEGRQILKTLLDFCPDKRAECEQINVDGTSPIMIAILKDNFPAIVLMSAHFTTEELTRKQIELGDESIIYEPGNLQNDETAIKLAVESGNPSIVEHLVKSPNAELAERSQNIYIKKLLSPQGTVLEKRQSLLVKLSRSFPSFNEEVEAKYERPDSLELQFEELKRFHLVHDGFLIENNMLKNRSRQRISRSTDTSKPMRILDAFCSMKDEENGLAKCKQDCKQKVECEKIRDLCTVCHLLQKDLKKKGLKKLDPKLIHIGSITEGTRLFQASEIDVTVQLFSTEKDRHKLNNHLYLKDACGGGHLVCVQDESELVEFADYDEVEKAHVYNHERFLEFFLTAVKDSLMRVRQGRDWPSNLTFEENEWNPCSDCTELRREETKSIFEPYQHCKNCLPAVTHTKAGPCLIFKWKDRQVLTTDLIPMFPVNNPDSKRGVMAYFDSVMKTVLSRKPENWLKHLKGVIARDRVLPETVLTNLDEEGSEVLEVSMKLLNYGPNNNYIIRPALKFLKNKEFEDAKANKEKLLKGKLKDIYVRFKALIEITGVDAKSYVIKKVVLSEEMRSQLENPGLNMAQRMYRVMKHPELEGKFKKWEGCYMMARQILREKHRNRFAELPKWFSDA